MSYVVETMTNLAAQTGFAFLKPGNFIMILVALVFLYLAIAKGYEPLLLVPISFGMLLVNLYPSIMEEGGLLHYFYLLDEWSILPSLIFLGVGALTDFGPLIANPASFLLGAAAQFGIYSAYFLAMLMGFNGKAAAAISIIGGADGPTSIFLAGKLGQTDLMGPIADSNLRTDRGSGIFLYVTRSDYSATDHEASYNRKRTSDQDGTVKNGYKDRENYVPDRRNSCCMFDSSYNSAISWYADAW